MCDAAPLVYFPIVTSPISDVELRDVVMIACDTHTRPMRPGLPYGAHDDRRPAAAAIGE
jgi:hypothetical protein